MRIFLPAADAKERRSWDGSRLAARLHLTDGAAILSEHRAV